MLNAVCDYIYTLQHYAERGMWLYTLQHYAEHCDYIYTLQH